MAEWISVKDRLPKEVGQYLVAYHPCVWENVLDEVRVGIDSFRGKNCWAQKKISTRHTLDAAAGTAKGGGIMAESLTAKIITEAKERADEFIFSTIYPFCSEVAEMHISKKELTDALVLWKKLVRCEDCKHHDTVSLNCEYLAGTTLDQWYCWNGERRTEA